MILVVAVGDLGVGAVLLPRTTAHPLRDDEARRFAGTQAIFKPPPAPQTSVRRIRVTFHGVNLNRHPRFHFSVSFSLPVGYSQIRTQPSLPRDQRSGHSPWIHSPFLFKVNSLRIRCCKVGATLGFLKIHPPK